MTKAEMVTRRWTWLVAVLAVALILAGGVIYSLVSARSVASCVNTSLGQRNAPNVADRVAQDRLNRAQDALNQAEQRDVRTLTGGDPARAAQAAEDLQNALRVQHRAYEAYRAQRAKDDAARARHPLGRC